MAETKNRPNIEDAYYFAGDCSNPEHRKTLAKWGAAYTLIALIGAPLFIAFGVPFIASFFK